MGGAAAAPEPVVKVEAASKPDAGAAQPTDVDAAPKVDAVAEAAAAAAAAAAQVQAAQASGGMPGGGVQV